MQKKTILLVEDNPDDELTLRAFKEQYLVDRGPGRPKPWPAFLGNPAGRGGSFLGAPGPEIAENRWPGSAQAPAVG